MPSRPQISFAASDDLVEALDQDAFNHDQPRSARIRAILVEYVRNLSLMDQRAPATVQLGQNNPRYNTRGRR